MPPSKAITDLNLMQQAAQLAVQSELLAQGSSTDQCRRELDALRGEVTSQISGLRSDLKESFAGINGRIDGINGRIDGLAREVAEKGTQYALIEQRLDLKEEEQERKEALSMALRKNTDRTPISNQRQGDSPPRGYPMGPNPAGYSPYVPLAPPPAPEKDKPMPLIKVSPKIWNTLILAIVAAAGGTAWHFIEHHFWPKAEPTQAVHEASK